MNGEFHIAQSAGLIGNGMDHRSGKPMNHRNDKSRIFLLSPANLSGKRGKLMWGGFSCCAMALKLRDGGAPLGEVFTFVSGLYFRGKLAYARAFARPPRNAAGVMVITASHGLMTPDTIVGIEELQAMAASSIDEREATYREPLERDARRLAARIGRCEVVLLGSVATQKYAEPLLGIFGAKLMFPTEFAGRGDMSRGGLMLRAVRDGVPLTYVCLANSMRHGPRPPKLPRLSKSPVSKEAVVGSVTG